MAGHGLFVVVHHHDGNARLLQAVGIGAQAAVLPPGQHDHIRTQRQHLVHGKALGLDIAHVGKLLQRRTMGREQGPAGWPPALPALARQADHPVEGLFRANGHVVFVVKAQQHPFGRRRDGHLASLDVGHFLLGGEGGGHQTHGQGAQGSGQQGAGEGTGE